MTMTTGSDRFARLAELTDEARAIVAEAIQHHVYADGRRVAATCVLYSGGNDSTVLAHLFRDTADYAVHINTGIGIEATREFVRETCAAWGLPLIEEHPPPGSTYDELVITHGFPGPAHHWKMYQRLKERGLRKVRKRLVRHPFRERVVFLAGRRRDESDRRRSVPEDGRDRSIVWASPLVNWTALDLNTYRMVHPDTPRNEVSALLHMSGECLCGAFARRDELDEIGAWYPETRVRIEALEARVRDAGHPAERCRWGWGAYRTDIARSRSGPLCSSCEGEGVAT